MGPMLPFWFRGVVLRHSLDRSTVICFCILVSFTTCKKKDHPAHDRQALAASDRAPSNDKEPSIARAVSKLTEGESKLARAMKSKIDEYYRELPTVKEAPARKPMLNPASFDSDIAEAGRALAAAKRVTPASHPELVQITDEVINTAQAVRKDFAEAASYYEAQTYKNDKGAGAKSIDARVRGDVGAYETAMGKLQARLASVASQITELEVKQFPENSYNYQFRAFNLAAKKLMDAVQEPANLAIAFDAVEASYTKLKKFADSHGDSLNPVFKGYMTQADNFEVQATAFMREKKIPKKDKESSQSSSLLASHYNGLVQVSNALVEMDAEKQLY
jgi:hypothetical protein